MPRKPSKIVCPKCTTMGGHLRKKWVRRTVHIPRADSITTISSAWDYASKVCLRRRELILLMPQPPDLGYTYSNLDMFNLHTNDEITEFISRHLKTVAKNIGKKRDQLNSQVRRTTEWKGSPDYEEYDQKRAVNKLPPKRTIHVKLGDDVGRVTKLSVYCLYYAIVCLVLRDLSEKFFANFPEVITKKYATSIYTFFSILEIDLRYRNDWHDWFEIFHYIEEHGYGYRAAATKTSISVGLCKNCSNVNKRILVPMERVDGGGREGEEGKDPDLVQWKCPKCGSEDSLKRSFTTKHLHNMHDKVTKKAKDIIEHMPAFYQFIDKFVYRITNNPELKRYFLERFQEYELLAKRDLLAKQDYYCIEHYDRSKKSKKRPCTIKNRELSNIKIRDDRYYSHYMPLIKEFVNSKEEEQPHGRRSILTSYAVNLLQELSWPKSLIIDKIQADITKAFVSNILKISG